MYPSGFYIIAKRKCASLARRFVDVTEGNILFGLGYNITFRLLIEITQRRIGLGTFAILLIDVYI